MEGRSGFLGLFFQPVTQEPCCDLLFILNFAHVLAGKQFLLGSNKGERGEALSPGGGGLGKGQQGKNGLGHSW